ncbi:MAG: hypothetical protein M9908_12595 [Phyllobacteriaceae bacterium]|nr:hypothetical protein [Phyllobacteriaceae bacterium]
MLAVEAARNAQEISGVKDINAAQMREGMESLNVDDARLEALGMAGFGPTVSVSCENHGGSGAALVQQWDAGAKKWNAITEFLPADRDLVSKLAMEVPKHSPRRTTSPRATATNVRKRHRRSPPVPAI